MRRKLLLSALFGILLLLPTSVFAAGNLPDSLTSKLALNEEGLQELLDDLGYDIDVDEDELGTEVFCALPGQNLATIILEVAGSASSASSGWYVAGDSNSLSQLFSGSASPGDSVTFSINQGDSVGFYLDARPYGSSTDLWFTENWMNNDGYNHAWVFSTGVPHEYLIAWEDLVDGGDEDHNDLVIKIRFANQVPTVTLPSDFSESQCVPAEICFNIDADDDNCEGDTITLEMVSGYGSFTPETAEGWISTSHCFTPTGTGTYQFVFKATDIVGDAGYDTLTITVTQDDEPPVLTCPSDITVESDPGECGAVVTYSASATDNCGSATIGYDPSPGSLFPIGTTQVEVIATDVAGNADTCYFDVTVNDTEAPVAQCPSDITVDNDAGECGAVVTFTVDGTDNCSGVTTTANPTSGTFFSLGTTQVEVISTDAAGNADTCYFDVTVNDTEAPVAQCPSDITVDNDAGECGAVVTFTVDGTDNCSGVTTTADPASGSFFAIGTTPVEVISTDGAGNADTCYFDVTVNETEPPVLTCPSDMTVDNDPGVCGAVVTFTPTATENCGTATIVSTPASGSTFPIGTTQVEVIATDAAGNADTCYFDVTVNDTEAPVAQCPSDITVDNDAGECGAVVDFTLDASDNCAGVTVSSTPASGGFFDVGTTQIEVVAVDAVGNADTCYFDIIVQDTEDPVAQCPSDITVDNDAGECGAVVTFTSTVTDNCPGATVTCDPASGSTFPVGTTTVTCTAVDASGNDATCTFTVTVNDAEDPVITCPPDIQLECGDPTDPSNTGYATAVDNCDTDILITYSDVQVDHIITRTWTATDDYGNSASCDQIITVGDGTPPVCTVPNDTTIFQCEYTEVQLPVSGTHDATCEVINGPGAIVGGYWTYTPSSEETVDVTVRCTDECDYFCEASFSVTFDLNAAPNCQDVGPLDYFVCADTTFNIEFVIEDEDGNLDGCSMVSGPGSFDSGTNIWTFTTNGSGTYTATIECVDDCGAVCTGDITVNVVVNSAPVCTVPADTTIFQCAPAEVELPFSATDVDDNLVGCTLVSSPGTLVGGNWVYTPAMEETLSVTIRCEDECGAYCEQTFEVIFDMNSAPVCSLPADAEYFVCADSTFNFDVSATDPDDNLTGCSMVSGVGNLTDGIWTFTTDGPGVYSAEFTCEDECGESCGGTVEITVNYNTAPTCVLPGDTTIFLCESAEVCLPVSGTDPDDNLVGCEVINDKGDIENGEWCYTPTEDETVDVTVRCTDECGAYSESQFTITFDLNEEPNCNIPDGGSYFGCADTTFSFVITATDPDNNLSGCTKVSGPGTFDDTMWTFTTSGSGQYVGEFTCTDGCGLTCSGSITIDFTLNSAPVCELPNSQVIGQCEPIMVSLPVGASDVDDNLASCMLVDGPGTIENSLWQYTPTGEETVDVTVRCTDDCGAYCEGSFQITFEIGEEYCIPPLLTIEKTHKAYQGRVDTLQITMENSQLQMGGFDFLISYDASALTVTDVLPGQLLVDCGWEYFTYRHGPFGECEGACPSGFLRIVALAELNDGPNHPDCYGPSTTDPSELVTILFYVTNDRTYECQYAPVEWFWFDCGDNSISNVEGTVLYVDKVVYRFEGDIYWDEEDNINYPESERIPHIGVSDECIEPIPGKPGAIRFLEFKNGGIDIICADSIDAGGDINLNEIANEVADAVLYTNYFIYGLGVFTQNVEGQIAASDVNSDGNTLTVGDLVYLIRIITGDASPYAKISVFEHEAEMSLASTASGMDISINRDADIGAIYLTFNAEEAENADVALADEFSEMDLMYDLVDGQLRVLVYDIGDGRIPVGSGNVMSIVSDGPLELVGYELADYYGADMSVTLKNEMIPTEFRVAQNFPNPFNPETEIALYLPEASDWTITIYNITGQEVKTFTGTSSAGMVSVRWFGRDDRGSEVASGVYFYKATAGKYSDTKKMLLLK